MVRISVKRIDDLGRVAIPKSFRKVMEVTEGDTLEVTLNQDGSVTLRKFVEDEYGTGDPL